MYERAHAFGHPSFVSCVAINECFVVTGAADSYVRVWALATGALKATLGPHQDHVTGVAITASRLVSCSRDHAARVWSLDQDAFPLRTVLEGHTGYIINVCMNNHYVVTASSDCTARVWAGSDGSLKATLKEHKKPVACACLSGSDIVTGSVDCTVRVWSNPHPPHDGMGRWSWRSRLTLEHPKTVLGVSASGDLLATGSDDYKVRVWSLLDGSFRWSLSSRGVYRTKDLSAMTFQGDTIIAKGAKGAVCIWVLQDGKAGRREASRMKPDPDHTFYVPKVPGQAVELESINQKCLASHRHYLVTGAGRTAVVWVTEPGQRRAASENLGVSLRFLLEEFGPAASSATGLADPTFREVMDAFWTGPRAKCCWDCDRQECPRDGKPGCSIADALVQTGAAGKATHFLSWTWSYRVSTMTTALRRWASKTCADPDQTFIWICFFVNNQYRILLEKSVVGSDDLGNVFSARLLRCGRALVLLDSFREPLYVRRVWCVYEIFQATCQRIPVEVILPDRAFDDLKDHLRHGRLDEITRSLTDISVEDASAWSQEDETNIKRQIRETTGYGRVNDAVQGFLSSWMVDSFRAILEQAAEDDPPPTRRAEEGTRPWRPAGGRPSGTCSCSSATAGSASRRRTRSSAAGPSCSRRGTWRSRGSRLRWPGTPPPARARWRCAPGRRPPTPRRPPTAAGARPPRRGRPRRGGPRRGGPRRRARAAARAPRAGRTPRAGGCRRTGGRMPRTRGAPRFMSGFRRTGGCRAPAAGALPGRSPAAYIVTSRAAEVCRDLSPLGTTATSTGYTWEPGFCERCGGPTCSRALSENKSNSWRTASSCRV
ncbi:unnamed protein product [Prorocentrum cordatum]|uniref:Vegetative incompatibility protein HET-E-1 n=1 Tax=Prorocentrum cordatum TaxID=2364126 RepID=A0ABN9X4S4_9DINO|nr:unnamed protein product [Polarella glacialis]